LSPVSWRDRAACRGLEPGWFVALAATAGAARSREHADRARAVCATCPVFADCEAYALGGLPGSDAGIYAGMVPSVRKARRWELLAAAGELRAAG
jgi:WhiB family transcriptional regulator, redox-sensing transcriptional regulator